MPTIETVKERLLHEERKRKEKDQGTSSAASPCEEVMTVKYKKRGPRCYFCNRFGHIQRYCHEWEKAAMEDGSPRDQWQKEKHKVNSLELRHQDDDIDSDEVGLIVQHALSVRVQSRSTDTNWIVDLGATCHVCNDHSSFVELSFLQTLLDITLGDGHTLKALGRGIVTLILESDFSKRKCVSCMMFMFLSLHIVSKAVEKGVSFTFSDHRCVIKDVNQRLITVATKVENLYHVGALAHRD